MICIRYTNWMSFYSLPCLFLLYKLLVMSGIYLIVDTSKHGRKMVWVAMMTFSLVKSCCYHQVVLAFIINIHPAFTIISSSFMTCLSTVLWSCNIYGSHKNLTKEYPILVGYEVFIALYLPL